MKEHLIKFGGFKKPKLNELLVYLTFGGIDKFKVKMSGFPTFLGINPETVVEFDNACKLEEFAENNPELKVRAMWRETTLNDEYFLIFELEQ